MGCIINNSLNLFLPLFSFVFQISSSSLTSVDIDWSNITDHIVPSGCFTGCTSLSSIDLTGAVRINQNAFLGCTALTAVTLPNTLTAIEDMVFRDSGLEELTIPSSVTYL